MGDWRAVDNLYLQDDGHSSFFATDQRTDVVQRWSTVQQPEPKTAVMLRWHCSFTARQVMVNCSSRFLFDLPNIWFVRDSENNSSLDAFVVLETDLSNPKPKGCALGRPCPAVLRPAPSLSWGVQVLDSTGENRKWVSSSLICLSLNIPYKHYLRFAGRKEKVWSCSIGSNLRLLDVWVWIGYLIWWEIQDEQQYIV